MKSLLKLLHSFHQWSRYGYVEGRTISRFIAKDVLREILVVSVERVPEGILIGRVRTRNLLYGSLIAQPDFGPPCELMIETMWHWTGHSWGGLSDGTSLVGTHLHPKAKQ